MAPFLRQEYIICYDVIDNKIRAKLFKEFERNGLKNVQKSVFWGYLTSAELKSLSRFIKKEIDKTDRVLITKTNFQGAGYSFLFGHEKNQFKDWEENCVI